MQTQTINLSLGQLTLLVTPESNICGYCFKWTGLHSDRLLASLTCIGLGWNWLAVTNTPAYYDRGRGSTQVGSSPTCIRLMCNWLAVTNTPAYFGCGQGSTRVGSSPRQHVLDWGGIDFLWRTLHLITATELITTVKSFSVRALGRKVLKRFF